MAPIRSLAEMRGLGASKLNTATLNRVCRELGTECVMVFTFETEHPESNIHVRMFAPLLGVPEDPATHIVSEQGAEINRPGTLYVELALSPVEGVDSQGEEISAVRVGGQVVLVAEGVVRFKRDSGG